MYSFASDNMAGVHPKIMDALAACNNGTAPAYGADEWSVRLNTVYSDLFEKEAYVFPCTTGTAANGLALSALSPAHGAIFCHNASHIVTAECGAPEFYSGGARLVLLPGDDSKVSVGAVTHALEDYGPGHIHQLKPSAISITQATERGCVYTTAEIAALSDIAHSNGMRMHMDGARFTNALVHLGVSPAQMTWKQGIDIISFGSTKNGTMMAEAVVVFDRATAEEVRFRHKRAGLLQSKMRYFAAQLIAYLEDDLWLKNAARANDNAQRLVRAFQLADGVSTTHAVEANEIFVRLPAYVQEGLTEKGFTFRSWPDPLGNLFRLVASYADDGNAIAAIESTMGLLAGKTDIRRVL